MKRIFSLGYLGFSLLLGTPAAAQHVVFVTGDEEYRSEESMPMLARILKRDYGFRVTVLYALDERGFIDPNELTNIPGLAALDSADLMVMFMRFRALPDSQLVHILDYVESGRPVVGFRTATHAFRYPEDSPHADLNEEWPTRVFGQHWIVHHGHFEDGNQPLTAVRPIEWRTAHPILRGVKPFQAYSWLYHVDGGGDQLYGDSRPLLIGEALRSTHAEEGRTDRYPLTNPVAWTKTYTGRSGRTARVFFTTLGHPYDFREESMRKLALNGILWALGLEDRIPPDGARADPVGEYTPTNSGFGSVYKQGMRPPPL
ncbi:MAG TPA: ThuA domain-containing protein [Longimicrobiaceae bacterium]